MATDWNHFRARGTFPTVIGEPRYTLPQGGREIIQLRYVDNGEPIDLVTIQEAARRGVKLEEPGRACVWLEDGAVIDGSNVLYRYRLAPVPDSILTVEREWFYHPSEVASSAQLPVQDQLVVLVKDWVRASLLELDQKYDAADRARRRYELNLDRLVRREKRKVAQHTQLKPSDLRRDGRRPQAMFPGDHFDNQWL